MPLSIAALRTSLTAMALALLVMAQAGPALAQAAKTLRWSGQGDALTFDPHAQNETPTIAALIQVYESLVRRAPDMSIEPSLATSWTTH